MPLFGFNPHLFSIAVRRPDEQPVPGATVRILGTGGADVTSVLLPTGSNLTDAAGLVTRFFNGLGPLPTGVAYTIQVIAEGYALWSHQRPTTWQGAGLFIADLVKITTPVGVYPVTEPGAGFVSSLHPILCSVESPATYNWELIRFHVEHLDGRSAIMEVPVEPGTQVATADLHSRARLPSRIHLVASSDTAEVDPNFSDELTVTLESLSDDGTIDLPGSFSVGVASMQPDVESNSLENYATGRNGGDGLQKWISLLKEPIAFRGYYFDTMIWLLGENVAYSLHTTYFNAAGQPVGSPPPITVLGSKQVQRFRLNANPDPSVRRAELLVKLGSVIVSDILTIHYRG